jgi:phospholipase/carboxylesterase
MALTMANRDDRLDCVQVGPDGADVRGVVIWLHGLGADGHDFEPIVPILRLPDVRFLFPNAPARPVTINMGFSMPAWYDILTLEPTGTREREEDILVSAAQIATVIDEQREAGVASDRIVLAGFSQGGAMALHVGCRYPHPLAGIMVLSAYHVLRDTHAEQRAPANAATPMLMCHGERDPVVPIGRGEQARDDMIAVGHPVEWRAYRMQHEVCPEEIAVIAGWLAARLP